VFSPPNLKEEILDVLAPVSIISVFTVELLLSYSNQGRAILLIGRRLARGPEIFFPAPPTMNTGTGTISAR